MDPISTGFASSGTLDQLQYLAEQHQALDRANEDSPAGSSIAEIENAAKEFESVFLTLMLKEMRNTLDQKEGGLFAGEGSDTLGGMFDTFMGQHLAKAQPLGIGDSVSRALNQYAQANEPE